VRPPRSRVAAARGAWAVGSVMTMIARLVQLVVAIVVLPRGVHPAEPVV
jgi:hypothetical protein